MKKLFSIISLLAFLLLAINIDASPPRHDVSKKVELSVNYDIVSTVPITIDNSVTINLLTYYVVDIGTDTNSTPIETDYGNLAEVNSEFRSNGKYQKYNYPEHNYLENYKRVKLYDLQNNKGFGSGAMGDSCL